MSWDDAIEVGRVARAHGLEGELQIVLHGGDRTNLLQASRLILDGAPGQIPYRVERADPMPASRGEALRVRMKLVGLDTRDRADAWHGARVLLEEVALAPLEPGEFYWRDLIGRRCLLPSGEELGVIEEIWPTPAHDLLVVRSGAQTHVIPALEDVIVSVDVAAGSVTVSPPHDLALDES